MKSLSSRVALFVITIAVLNSCTPKKDLFQSKVVYKSKELLVTQITDNSFVHTSFKQTDEFGNVPCNGLVVRSKNEAIVFDTPTDDKNSEVLIQWINETLHCKIKAIIPTHFHDDCLGGLKAFHEKNIPSYAYYKTIRLTKENHLTVPQNSFSDSLTLPIGNETVTAQFFGEGHTKDNITGYFPTENVLFGGCLLKELKANKGYLGDSNTAEWSNTVEKVKLKYPNVQVVVPGHGKYGDSQLLDYTITLFKSGQ